MHNCVRHGSRSALGCPLGVHKRQSVLSLWGPLMHLQMLWRGCSCKISSRRSCSVQLTMAGQMISNRLQLGHVAPRLSACAAWEGCCVLRGAELRRSSPLAAHSIIAGLLSEPSHTCQCGHARHHLLCMHKEVLQQQPQAHCRLLPEHPPHCHERPHGSSRQAEKAGLTAPNQQAPTAFETPRLQDPSLHAVHQKADLVRAGQVARASGHRAGHSTSSGMHSLVVEVPQACGLAEAGSHRLPGPPRGGPIGATGSPPLKLLALSAGRLLAGPLEQTLELAVWAQDAGVEVLV